MCSGWWVVVTREDSRVGQPGFRSGLFSYSSAVWPWERYLSSLCFSFPPWWMGPWGHPHPCSPPCLCPARYRSRLVDCEPLWHLSQLILLRIEFRVCDGGQWAGVAVGVIMMICLCWLSTFSKKTPNHVWKVPETYHHGCHEGRAAKRSDSFMWEMGWILKI